MDGEDRRRGSPRHVAHHLSNEERQRILLTCNHTTYAPLPPGQIVAALADQNLLIGSESSLYRVAARAWPGPSPGTCMTASGANARAALAGGSLQCCVADRSNAVWSWDITFLPTTVRGVWLCLYLVIDVWNRKVVPWDVAEREDAQIAADLVGRGCLRERVSKGCRRPLVLHADNVNAMRAATLEARLEELGVLRSFSRPRVSNDNPHPESLLNSQLYLGLPE